MLKTTVFLFGACIQTTMSVEQLLQTTIIRTIDPDANRIVEGTQRQEFGAHVNTIKQSLAAVALTDSPFPTPIVLNLLGSADSADAVKIEHDEKFLKRLARCKLEVIDGQQRRAALRELVDDTADIFEKARLLALPVEVKIYFNLNDSLAKMLFIRINSIKKISPATTELFLQQVYKDDRKLLLAKDRTIGKNAAIAYDLATTNPVFNRRVEQLTADVTGPSFATLFSTVSGSVKTIGWLDQEEHDVAVDLLSDAWRALGKSWNALNHWHELAHNNMLEIGMTLATRLIQAFVEPTDAIKQLDVKKSLAVLTVVIPKIDKLLQIKGNPHLNANYGGAAGEWSNAVGKAQLRDIANKQFEAVLDELMVAGTI